MIPETTTAATATAPQELHKMRADALSTPGSPTGRVKVCPACTAKFEPIREWQDYCSAKCRKLAWRIGRRLTLPTDDRATLKRIESRLEAIEIKLSGGKA
jgi:hypothetical protein